MRSHLLVRKIGQAQSVDRGGEHQSAVVKHQLPFDAHPELVSILVEFPRVKAAMRWRTQIDAIMRGQILWRSRGRPSLKVGWRTDNRHAHVRANADRYHPFGDISAGSYSGIVALRGDISQA